MHTFTTLAVLALAASTVSPVLSAPVQDNQAQARAELEERFAFGTLFKDLVRQGFLGGMFGLGQTATTSGTLRSFEPYGARDSSEQQHRDLSNLLTLAISSSLNSQNNNKRTPELGKPHVPGPHPEEIPAPVGLVSKRDESMELLEALNRILRRAVNELD